MSNTRIKSLAKLREYRAGMDMEEYLSTEFLQNLNFIDQKLRSLDQAVVVNDICVRYTSASGQSIPSSVLTVLNFETKDFDSDSLVTVGTSWRFKAKEDAIYEASGFIVFTSGGGWGVGEEVAVNIHINGVSYARIGGVIMQAAHGTYVEIPLVACPFKLRTNEYMDLRVYQSSGASLSLLGGINWISIKKIGAY
ncbi:MAG TPA: hypothetical protein VIG33_14860 [Pseudobdellovibrionaceae bacterium]|jgi:hypothetical protein